MTTVEKIKAKILDLAIRGKLVPQNPDDEPASVLLGRIKAEKAKLVKAGKIKKDKNPSEIVVSSDGATYEKFADGKEKDISKEIPFELPQGWAWARLGDLFQHNTGKALNRSSSNGVLKEYITTSNVYWDGLMLDNLRQMPFTDEELDKCTVKKGDLLVCEGGDIGRAAIWHLDRSVCIQNHLHRLRPFLPEICVPYFCNMLRYYKVTNQLQGKGIGLQGFSSGMVHNLLAPLPPRAEQTRIVAKIEELFSYVDKIGKAADGIAQAAQRINKKILDLAIRGQLVPQDPNDEPVCELIRRIEAAKKATEKGHKSSRTAASDRPAYETEPPFDIPDSWEWVKLGDLFQHNTGKALNRSSSNGALKEYITTSNVYWDGLMLDNLRQMPFTDEELDKCTVKKGDLLVCEGGDIGRAAIWHLDRSVCIQNHLHRLRPFLPEICVPYFCNMLRYYKVTNQLQGKGIGLQGFSSGMVHNLLVPLPPLAEQKRILAKIEELRAMTRSLTK